MKITIRRKRFLDWDEETRKQICKLRFKDGWFRYWQTKQPERLDTLVAFVGKNPVGSCMIYDRQSDDPEIIPHEAGVYVHHEYRRLGIGGMLLRRCAKYYDEFEVYSHWSGNHKFFESFSSEKMVVH